jgi:hypothetical protein
MQIEGILAYLKEQGLLSSYKTLKKEIKQQKKTKKSINKKNGGKESAISSDIIKTEAPMIEKDASDNENEKNIGKHNMPFCRINMEEVEFQNEKLKDNCFMSKGGALDSYGLKAYKDLSVTRGKGFTKEKNKKKKGSYRGGKIDTSCYSIKFDA